MDLPSIAELEKYSLEEAVEICKKYYEESIKVDRYGEEVVQIDVIESMPDQFFEDEEVALRLYKSNIVRGKDWYAGIEERRHNQLWGMLATVYGKDKMIELEDKIKEALAYELASDLHEAWRAPRKREDGTYEPRMKKSKDEEWNKTHRTDDVDIANLSFEELPSNWQYENLEAAKVAIDQAFDEVMNRYGIDADDTVPSDLVDDMAAEVHEEWLSRNAWVYDEKYGNPDQAKPYSELSWEEQEKDKDQIYSAIDMIKAFKRGQIDINALIEKYRLGDKIRLSPSKRQRKEAELKGLQQEDGELDEELGNISQEVDRWWINDPDWHGGDPR